MHITLLGTGTSHGVPMLDCMLNNYARCPRGTCIKALSDPHYRRTRASLLVEANGTHLLLDTSQDFRQQMLAQRVPRLDAVLYTHGHADHIYGLPDIRSYCRHQHDALDIYGSEETLDILHAAFGYVFHPPENVGGGIPVLRAHVLDAPTTLHGLLVTPVPVLHGSLRGCQGYRLSLADAANDTPQIAYLPDVGSIPPASLERLHGLDLLILNCLRYTPHATHLSLAQSLAYAEQLRPQHCLLTHLAHDIDDRLEEPRLPPGVRFAYDGLVVDL